MTGIDDLTYVIEEAVRDAEGGSYYPTVDFRRAARDSLTAIQSVLRERGVLLGPDGLIKAEETGRWWDPIEHEVVRSCVFSHHVPLVTLYPQDPTEEP